MPSIRPISDLRNHFAEITQDVQSSKEPVYPDYVELRRFIHGRRNRDKGIVW